jgi:putative nucleotidyltransferase with HDIG domain
MPEESISNGIEEKESKEELQQLLDSTYPLLQKFREACPGTYKHSQNLAAMVEGIALSLGLDVTKLKVAAQYHDVGKMCNPKYFSENQLEDECPHSGLSPLISYNIITKHVSDSAMLLINDHNFPRDIIEIISQHHGQSVLRYFFDKSGSAVEDMFRYKTPKPTCVESAVLMISDHIEAKSRSLIQANKFDPSVVIENTISELIDDGQLDEVYMKLGDLKKIKEALAKELEGTYQKRVDYDKAKELKKEEKDVDV